MTWVIVAVCLVVVVVGLVIQFRAERAWERTMRGWRR